MASSEVADRQTETEREHSCRRGIHLSLDDADDDDDEQLQLRFELDPNLPSVFIQSRFALLPLTASQTRGNSR